MRTGQQLEQSRRSSPSGRPCGSDVLAELLESLRSKKPVQGLTHGFYRYPGRFSPEFARSVINAFSRPGDTILDPFVGGGTTVVEALAAGRRIVGVDLNSLAIFIARIKSSPLSSAEIRFIRRRIEEIAQRLPRFRGRGNNPSLGGLFENVPWWIRNCCSVIDERLRRAPNRQVRAFLRCGLLKTAQWALDCRKFIPSSSELFEAFCTNVLEMCDHMEEYVAALRAAGFSPKRQASRCRRLLLRSAVSVDEESRIPADWLPVRLVVTSPPYPGVHMLYHRWQVQGRRETPAPYAILASGDGYFSSYYTFGDHRRTEPYFETLTAAYKSIANLLAPSSLVVQLVSFNNPRRDIDHFLEAMAAAGFEEKSLKDLGFGTAERPWRVVPNRKWYVEYREGLQAGKELLLFHQLKENRRHRRS